MKTPKDLEEVRKVGLEVDWGIHLHRVENGKLVLDLPSRKAGKCGNRCSRS
jgi:hypothetical protein